MEPLLACLGYGQAQRKIVLPHTVSRGSHHGESIFDLGSAHRPDLPNLLR